MCIKQLTYIEAINFVNTQFGTNLQYLQEGGIKTPERGLEISLKSEDCQLMWEIKTWEGSNSQTIHVLPKHKLKR